MGKKIELTFNVSLPEFTRDLDDVEDSELIYQLAVDQLIKELQEQSEELVLWSISEEITESNLDFKNILPGLMVYHPKYGDGFVIENQPESNKVTIYFGRGVAHTFEQINELVPSKATFEAVKRNDFINFNKAGGSGYLKTHEGIKQVVIIPSGIEDMYFFAEAHYYHQQNSKLKNIFKVQKNAFHSYFSFEAPSN